MLVQMPDSMEYYGAHLDSADDQQVLEATMAVRKALSGTAYRPRASCMRAAATLPDTAVSPAPPAHVQSPLHSPADPPPPPRAHSEKPACPASA